MQEKYILTGVGGQVIKLLAQGASKSCSCSAARLKNDHVITYGKLVS